MSGTDYLVLAAVVLGAVWIGWIGSGVTARLFGRPQNSPLRLVDTAATALVIILAFVIFTLT
jgi:hypothetical protein